jgi:selT/selW/selH-like putative selenoprotein
LAASLKSRFGENVEVKPGKTGQFDVVLGGKVIFSKGEAGRFPVDNEVEELFAKTRS